MRRITSGHNRGEQGQIIILTLVFMLIMFAMSAALLGYTVVHVKGMRQTTAGVQALELAQAGVEKAIYELNQNSTYTGETETAFANGEFTVTITNIDANTKQAQVTSYVPNSTNPTSTKTIKVRLSIDTSTVSFNFGVQVGEGGLTMSNNSVINGNVFSNGNISGSGVVTGDASVGAGVSATADQVCENYNADYTFADFDNNKRDIAQKFVPTISGSLNRAQFYLKKVGSPSNLTVRVMPHNASQDKPSHNGQLGGSGTLASVGTSYGWIDVSFASSPTLTAGTTYWLVIDSSGNTFTDYYTIGVDATEACSGAGKYTNSYSSSSANWTPINGGNGGGADLNFRTYVGGNTTTLSGVTVQGSARAQAMSSCTIGGSAYFENSSTTCSVGGSQNPGTTAPSPQALPISDSQIQDWKDDATNGGVYTGNQSIVNGATETWGARKIVGDLTISNNGTLYMTGPIWVTGSISISNNGVIRVDNSVGSASLVIMSGGSFNISNNTILTGNNSPGSYLLVLSTATGGTAINLSNNTAGAIFYASSGTINVSNNAGGNQLTGYAINMSNNSTVTYSSGLASTTFSNGPGASWAFVPGSYVIEP
jgi:hypothetical protein